MTTYPSATPIRRRGQHSGFTLVELLVVITVIGILVSLLSVGVTRVLVGTREFAVKTEMNQIEAAIEKFETDYGFYPPSFKNMDVATLTTYINRIAPNNLESVPDGNGDLPIDLWWQDVGQAIFASTQSNDINDAPGSDLVFWLSGLAKNKQRPLTTLVQQGTTLVAVPNAAHNYIDGGDGIERQEYFEFDRERIIEHSATNKVVTFLQPAGRDVVYLYRSGGVDYLPSDPEDPDATDGAYTNSTFRDLADMERRVTIDDVVDAAVQFGGNNPRNISLGQSQVVFNRIYPNPDSFQLITFGLDGLPGGIDVRAVSTPKPNPNVLTNAGPAGADNIVNFGATGPGRLDTIIFDSN